MSRRPTHLLATLPLVLAAACSSSDETDGGGGGGGGDAATGDAAAPDTGAGLDAGQPDAAQLGCDDPFAGTGCSDATKTCVWVTSTDQVQCRSVGAMPKALEEPCSTSLLDCGPGLTCMSLQGEAGPTCKKVCSTQGGSPGAGVCSTLVGASPRYSCSGLTDLTYGVCVGSQATMDCTPYMDMCPADQTCTLVNDETVCAPSGAVARGGNCAMDNCVKGSTCVGLQGDPNPSCYETCNPQMPMCSGMGNVCLGLNVGFGICRTPVLGCDPLNDMCPAGQVCSFDNPNLQCLAEGTVAIGGDCTNGNCQRGGICIFLQGEATPICYAPCDVMAPMCPMGQACGNIGLAFGLCVTN